MSKKNIIRQRLTASPGLSVYDLRNLAQAEPKTFLRKYEDLVNDGKIRLGDINWTAFHRFFADLPITVVMPDITGTKRAITTSMFPILTGTTAIKAINDAYLNYASIGQDLVEEIEDAKKITTLASIHNMDSDVDEVKEGDDFPEIGSKEEKVEIRHKPNGRIVKITANMISENEAADITSRLNGLGVIAADWIEEQTLYRIYDYYGSAASPAAPYVYRPDGTGTALYSATANTPGVRAPSGNWYQSNALEDETDLENARTRLRSMVNERAKRINIPWSEVMLLVPDALIGIASKIMNSEYVPGVVNEKSNWGPPGMWHIPPERIKTSPKCDDISTSAWLLGAFRRQFKRKWKLRFEYVSLGMDTQAYLQSRIAAQFRVAWDCEIGAVDYVNVIINTTSTSMPKDA